VATLAAPPRHVTDGLKVSSDGGARTISTDVSCFGSADRSTVEDSFLAAAHISLEQSSGG
jgi:hypothetical protein